MEIPEIDRRESQDSHDLAMKHYRLLGESLATEGLAVAVREHDKAESFKLGLEKQRSLKVGGAGSKT
ncbi:hypothetical protein JCM1841_005959 [Sporobolomyces salmonicolor]